MHQKISIIRTYIHSPSQYHKKWNQPLSNTLNFVSKCVTLNKMSACMFLWYKVCDAVMRQYWWNCNTIAMYMNWYSALHRSSVNIKTTMSEQQMLNAFFLKNIPLQCVIKTLPCIENEHIFQLLLLYAYILWKKWKHGLTANTLKKEKFVSVDWFPIAKCS